VVVVPPEHGDDAVDLLAAHHPGAARIGTITGDAGRVAVPALGLIVTA
jgi:hypothetical protein